MQKLEESRFFPYVAWATVVGFALFTYNLTLKVNGELSTINSGLQSIDARLDRIENHVEQGATSPDTVRSAP